MDGYQFPEDRFEDYDYSDAIEAYEAEPTVHLLFEMGAGTDQPGAPIPRYEAFYDTWPPADTGTIEWYLGPDGALTDTPLATGVDTWTFDPNSGDDTFFGPAGYELFPPLWDIE